MAIKVGQAFERTSAQPIDTSLALTKAQMVSVNDNLMPPYYFTICQDDGKIYLYDKSATASGTTGKFKKFDGGSGGGADIYSTTDTLNDEINGTKVVLAADLPGVTLSDLTVGSSIIKDGKGTLGIVTAITGTTSVTVTTATTSTPVKELTQEEYDALPQADKDNGTIYFITDGKFPGTVLGAHETIYSTTERVIGSYLGKPLYQRTYDLGSVVPISSTTWYDTGFPFGDCDLVIKAWGLAGGGPTSSANASTPLLCYAESSSPNFRILAARDNSGIGMRYFTVQYTKTTDTASAVEYANVNDYSTSEKIVGTWIDGKPIYQKTFVTTLPDAETFGTVVYKKVETGAQIETLVDQKGKFNTPSNGLWHDAVLDVDLGNNWNYAVKALVYDNNASSENANRIMLGNANTAWNSSPVHITIKYTKVSN